LDVIDPTSIL